MVSLPMPGISSPLTYHEAIAALAVATLTNTMGSIGFLLRVGETSEGRRSTEGMCENTTTLKSKKRVGK
jgi:hypothetical protein